MMKNLATGKRDELDMEIVLDDATKVFDVSMDKIYAMGIRSQQLRFKQVREYGLGLIVSDQSSQGLSRIVPENTMTKIASGVVLKKPAIYKGFISR